MLIRFSRRDIFFASSFFFFTKKNLLVFFFLFVQATLCPVSAGMTGILQWDAGPPVRDYDSVFVTLSGMTTLTLILK